MKDIEVNKLTQGLYIIYWRGGKKSLASVGLTRDGSRWMAPCNWTGDNTHPQIADIHSWFDVESVVLISYIQDDKVHLIPEATSPERERKLEQIREILRTI